MDKNNAAYLQEFASGLFPRWWTMAAGVIAVCAAAVPIVLGVIGKVDWWWIVLFPVLLAVFITMCFIQFRRVAIERDKLKHRDGLTFYPHRPDMHVALNFIKRHEVIYGAFATGQALRDAEVYKDLDRFKYVVLLHPDKSHLRTYATAFYDKTYENLRANVRDTAKEAEPCVKEVLFRDGCLPYSIMIGDPESQDNRGEILIEFHIPYKEYYDRPSFIFEQKDYPDLFKVLKQSYDRMVTDARQDSNSGNSQPVTEHP